MDERSFIFDYIEQSVEEEVGGIGDALKKALEIRNTNIITVTTKYNKDIIEQDINDDFDPLDTTARDKHIVDLQDEGIREALINLGWTPPKE